MRLGDADRPKARRPWSPPPSNPAPGRDQLLAIAASVHETTIDDCEWACRIKDRIAKLNMDAAPADTITLVIRLLSKRLPRQYAEPQKRNDPLPSGPNLTRDECRRIYADIETRFKARRVLP